VNDTWMSRIPLASSDIWTFDGGSKSWNCEPMKDCDDRQSFFFRAEVMGGGSRINGMVYTRGSAADYDGWAASGHPEWSYEKVLPYFVKGETSLDHPKSSYRGHSGEWDTARKTIISHDSPHLHNDN
jgi:choline dehydrogenase-like flavoprotein